MNNRLPTGLAKSIVNLQVLIILEVLTLSLTPPSFAFFETKAEEQELTDLLETKLTQNSPPAGMLNHTVFLFIGVYQILDVDEKNGHLTMKLWMYVYYRFNSPLWDPKHYKNVTRLQFKPNTFWVPDIVILDAVDVLYESFDYQAVFASGVVTAWSSMVTVKFSCSFDVSRFPFDKHYCPIRFSQWFFEVDDYTINHDVDFGQSEVVDMAFYKPHDQWNLVEPILFQNDFRSWQNIFNYSDKRLHLYIARDPTFYFYIFVCPIIILHVLSPFVFLLPVESGEKISMSITLLLAQTVSMSGIADVLPASSRNFPIISYFLGLSVVQIGIQTLLTVLVINIHGTCGSNKLPYPLKWLLGTKITYVFGLTPLSSNQIGPLDKPQSRRGSVEKTTHTNEGNQFLRENTQRAAETDRTEQMEYLWKRFAVLLDRILFVVNVVIIIALFTTLDQVIITR